MAAFTQQLFDPTFGLRVHRPLIGWSAAILTGAALGFFLGHPLLWLILGTAAIVLAWHPRHLLPGTIALALAALCLTAWRAAREYERNAMIVARLQAHQQQGDTFPLTLIVSNDRQIIPRKRGGPYCRFSADDAWFADGTEIHGVNLQVYYYNKAGLFPQTGETWQVEARLRKNSRRDRPALSVHAGQLAPQQRQSHHLQYRFAPFRERLAEHLALGIPSADAALLQTMLLGRRNRMAQSDRRRYADAGIIHIFAISGLHVGLIAGFLLWLFAYVRLRLRALIIAPILIGYLLLTGIPPSAARACTMALLYCLAPTLCRKPNATTALFLTAAAIILIEPAWIANIGAILSFCVMGGILLLMPPLTYFANRVLHSLPQRTPPGELPGTPKLSLRLRQSFASLLALTLSAWVTAAPLSLAFFGRLSLIGLALNLFIPFLTLAIIWTACISAFAGFFFPLLSITLNRLAATFLNLLSLASDTLLAIPGSTLIIDNRPGFTTTFLLEAALLLAGLWLRLQERKFRLADPFDPLIPRLDSQPPRAGM